MQLPRTVVICSFRLGGTDGVAVEAAKWATAFSSLGCAVRTVAGEGNADVLVPGLAAASPEPPGGAELAAAFAGSDLVVVENLCSLPLNPGASRAVADELAGRPAILHHHDLASQRSHLAHLGPPPDDPSWLHVCVNRRSTAELNAYGYSAVTCHNCFSPDPAPGQRDETRARAGVGTSERLVLQPTRAIARKAVPAGLELAERLGATYWLLGPAEDGYDDELERTLSGARVPVVRGRDATRPGHVIEDAYAASDLVVLPSTWEGFGNPAIESATHRRGLAIGPYPVGRELRGFGFAWFDVGSPDPLREWLAHPEESILEHNWSVARRYFSLDSLPTRIARLVRRVASTIGSS
ncbi:MAG TPA: hypothetical protein VND23_00285 [Acidimicrobiales bacterium]|nr:hypothetical protein [Acidimicrobiales bacterium]